MKINKCICDRCGVEINEPHPDRMVIEKYSKDYGYNGARYVKKKTVELCEGCRKAFDEFMKGEKS